MQGELKKGMGVAEEGTQEKQILVWVHFNEKVKILILWGG